MKSSFAIIVALGVCVMSTGCSKNKPPADAPAPKPPAPAPAVVPAAQDGPAWKLMYSANCAADEGDQCKGKYGLTVIADGHYQVGPGPKGQVLTGVLKDEEFKAIHDIVSQAQDSQETCGTVEAEEFNDALTLTRRTVDRQVVRTQGNQFCFQIASADQAQALHKAMVELTEARYPIPFGNDCYDSSQEVLSQYASLQSCSLDADCSYADPAYNLISSGTDAWVTTDDCTFIPPIAVGSISGLSGAQDKLNEGIAKAQEVCGGTLWKDGCTQTRGFRATAAPICQRGVCQINPTITIE